MKTNLLLITACAALLVPKINVGQVNLGSTSDYVLFTSSGAVGNTGISHITGNIGTNVGAITAFGNVDGTLNAANAASSVCVTDLTTAYNQLLAMPATTNHVAVIATGEILTAGVYTIAAAGSAVGTFSLDAQSNANAQFVFRFGGAFTTAAATEVYLMNGAKACNVFWIAEGAIAIGANTTMKGTVISHNAAISMAAGGKLEGRLFSTAGAVSIDGALVYLPLGCGSPILTGPTSPNLASTACYALFSANGAVTNTATTMVTGDVGTNVGLTSGFTLTPNTELLYPAQLGNKLVLTPHTYTLNAATMLTDTLFLNAQNNANAVFAILINGALTTSSNAKVILQNGALAKNVFWLVNGNVNISTNSNFIGTVVSNGAIDLATGVKLDGRALTTVGSVTSNSVTVVKPSSCVTTDVQSLNIANSNQAVSIYPNPFSTSLCINLHNAAHINTSEFLLYDVVGEMVLSKVLTKQVNMVETCDLPSGVYFYKVLSENKTIQSGRLISQQ
jgi:hypothetical protein